MVFDLRPVSVYTKLVRRIKLHFHNGTELKNGAQVVKKFLRTYLDIWA